MWRLTCGLERQYCDYGTNIKFEGDFYCNFNWSVPEFRTAASLLRGWLTSRLARSVVLGTPSSSPAGLQAKHLGTLTNSHSPRLRPGHLWAPRDVRAKRTSLRRDSLDRRRRAHRWSRAGLPRHRWQRLLGRR